MRFGLPDATVDKICSAFSAHPEVERAVVYGSRAKGTFKNGSDIDLTLFGQSLPQKLLLDLTEELDELLLPYSIDLSIFADIQHPELREHIERVGQVFYERSGTYP